MKTAQEVLDELRPLGRENYKRVLFNHGAREPCFGVKIEELKKLRKRIGTNYQLALDLYDTGNYDAMYLAGLIADDAWMTKANLQHWAQQAYGGSLPSATVPGVAAGSRFGWELALEWIESKQPLVASVGWATLSAIASVTRDEDLDAAILRSLLQRVDDTIHQQPNDVRYAMNGFVIAVGRFVRPLMEPALGAAERMGVVHVDVGNTQCQVPSAPDYIRKVESRGTIGKKRKSAKC
ncbi:MAG: DNA alkylation repair protein [Chthoniobacteraceae bacterium]